MAETEEQRLRQEYFHYGRSFDGRNHQCSEFTHREMPTLRRVIEGWDTYYERDVCMSIEAEDKVRINCSRVIPDKWIKLVMPENLWKR